MTSDDVFQADDPPIRDAATIVLVRRDRGVARVLMGQRGAGAVFMPGKFVFPGGRVDKEDATVPLGRAVPAPVAERLRADSVAQPESLAAAAIRELWEEAGLRLAVPAPAEYTAAPGWETFCKPGVAPDGAALDFFFRAVTPPGRPRRFDARFFLCRAESLWGDPDDFSAAGDELSHLGWLPLPEARALETPFVTRVALGELQTLLDAPDPARPVPFFEHRTGVSRFRAL